MKRDDVLYSSFDRVIGQSKTPAVATSQQLSRKRYSRQEPAHATLPTNLTGSYIRKSMKQAVPTLTTQ